MSIRRTLGKLIEFKNILERRNRGILLDIVMFAVTSNVFFKGQFLK